MYKASKSFVSTVALAAILAPAVFIAPQASAEETKAQQQNLQVPGMVQRALSWIGVRYRFGGQDEKKGFDCAGLVRKAFSSMAIDLPRTAAAQYGEGCIVPREDLRAGDLVFFRNTYKRGISHVGIYIGDGAFVHAASTRRAVTIDRLDTPYFATRFAGGRRVLVPSVFPTVPTELRFP